MMEEHMVPFIRKWKLGCGFYGEQGNGLNMYFASSKIGPGFCITITRFFIRNVKGVQGFKVSLELYRLIKIQS